MRPDAPGTLRGQRQRKIVVVAAALTACLGASTVRADEYRLQPGDTIEVSVAGASDMNVEASVQIDGSLDIPLVGEIMAAGLSAAEVRNQIQTALAGRMLPVYLADGREQLRVVERDQIVASIAEYRPVFITGDVLRPGEVTYRPGMTIRQAVAAAGGVPSALAASLSNAALLKAEYTAAWHAAVSAGARVWRLRQELGEETSFDAAVWPPALDANDTVAEVLRVEADLRATRRGNLEHERVFLEQTLAQIESQMVVLRSQLDVEKQNEKVDAEALGRAIEDSELRVYLKDELPDLRTAALFSATRRLQAESNLMQTERRHTEVERDLQRLGEDQRVAVLSELRDARIAEVRERAGLQAAEERLREAGISLDPTAKPGVPGATVIRGGIEVATSAPYDSEILPGDVVEVTRDGGATPFAADAVAANPRIASALR